MVLMIPTLFGISLVVWLIMVAAPGRPGEKSGGMGEDPAVNADPTKEQAKGESQYIFRRQYALDRPVLWNDWTELSKATVLDSVERARAPIEKHGPAAKLAAKERLEDWGTYAVPALVDLLDDAEVRRDPALQDRVLVWLRLSATRRTVVSRDPEVVARNQEFAKENAELAKWAWPASATTGERDAVVAKWSAWFAAHKDERWSWSSWDRVRIGLTDTQFGTYWGRLARLDLGVSHVHKRPVLDLIRERIPITAGLALVSILLIYVLAIPLGIFSAVRPYGVADRSVSVGLFLLYSLPSFFVGTVLLRALTVGKPFAWFPTSGWSDSGSGAWDTWTRCKDIVWHCTLPLVVMTYGALAGLSRFARTGMLDVIRSDYVRTARAKGLSEPAVILRHAARNGMMPVVTLLAGFLPALVGGSVIVEFTYNIEGMGLLTLEAINNRDYNVVVGETLIVAVLTQLGILLADVLYAVLDPRISYS